MPIVIKEIIVRTTVERTVKEAPVDQTLIRRIEQRVLDRLKEEDSVRNQERGKDR